MKTILIIKLLITLSIINYLKSSSNIEDSKLDIELIKHLIQNKLEMFFPTFKISDLLYLVELILSETTEGNLNFKCNNKLPIQSSLNYANSISLKITIEEDELTKLISSDNSDKSESIILECLKRLNQENTDMKHLDFPISIYFDSTLDRPLILKQLNNKSGIYCWYCKPSGNMYVGSAVNLRTRTSDYYQASYIKNRKHLPIIRAMQKYGMDQFSLIILEYTNKDNLIRSEQYWIDFITPGYNILTTAGNWSNHHHSEEAKLKISNSRTGKSHTEEVKRLISLTRQKEDNPFYGKNHSKETKDLLRVYQSLRSVDPNPGFSVNLYSSENKLLLVFKSIRETAKYFKADTRTINRYLDSNKLFRGKYYLRNKDI
jgi:group I intron endonuclease